MLKELKSQHRTIIQMSFNGFSNNEIAEKLGMAHTTVSIILKSPLGQAYLNGLHDRAKEATLDVRKKLISLNQAALNTFERILDPKQKAPFNVQYSTAKDILDRNGYKPQDKISLDMSMSVKSDAELDAEIRAVEESIKRTQGIDISKEAKSLPAVATTIGINSIKATSSTEKELNLDDSDYFFDEDIIDVPSNEELFSEDDDLPIDEETAEILSNPGFNPFHNIGKE